MTGYIGAIKFFAGNFAPKDWMYCAGQLLQISEYTPLYAIIGDRYGGDGRNTIALPDLRQRVAIGTGRGPGLDDYYLAQKGGASAVGLTTDQMPVHQHTIIAQNDDGDSTSPKGNYLASSHGVVEMGRDVKTYENKAFTDSNPINNMYHGAIGNTGNNTPHYNMQPYLVCNYIICVDGLFPRRS